MTSAYANLEKERPYILSVLRIVVALLFLEHGLQKYFGFPSAGSHDDAGRRRYRHERINGGASGRDRQLRGGYQ